MAAPRAFREMPKKHLECRSLMHAWAHKRTELEGRGVIVLYFRCMRCPTARTDRRQRSNGDLLGRTYHYRTKDGYQVENIKDWGGRKVFNSNVNQELVRRYVEEVR